MQFHESDAERIFLDAVENRSPGEWHAYIGEACGDDSDLRSRVRDLLDAYGEQNSLLDGNGMAMTIAAPCERPGTQIGPYKLREQIGEGGFGVVYVAEQAEPVARKVALKIIKPGMDTKEVIARFEAERQALALMDHPSVAKVFDAGATDSGRPFFVMELVHGVPITDFSDDQKLSPRERLPLFVDVCRAVQHAHQKGIIHRDLKPTNVMVTLHDDKPVVKVIDFGVSKALSSKLTDKTLYTAYGQMVGTPLYMSPEQAQLSGLDVDTRSDVYSLGVLLYELLTGTTPFDKEALQKAGFDELRRIIREDEPVRPSARISTLNAEQLSTVSGKRRIDPRKLSQSLRGELDWIVMKALEKDRTRRYESASALASDVERYLKDEPVLACPPSIGYRLGKFLRRYRGPVLTASLLLLVLIGGIIGTTWGLILATEAEADAKSESSKKEQALIDLDGAIRELRDEQRRTQIQLSSHLLERGLALCEKGDVDVGLQWFAHSLTHVPSGHKLQRVIRTNLAAWHGQTCRLKAIHSPGTWEINSAAFSPDGKRLLVAIRDSDGQCKASILDAVTGKQIGEPFLCFKRASYGPVFSQDGKTILTLTDANTAQLWDVAGHRTIGAPLEHSDNVNKLQFSDDGRLAVTQSYRFDPKTRSVTQREIRLWLAATGKPFGRPIELAGDAGLRAIRPDGTTVATGHLKGVQLWNTATGERIGSPLQPPDLAAIRGIGTGLHQIAFSPDGRQLLTIYTAALSGRRSVQKAQLWDVASTKPLGKPHLLEAGTIDAVFSPDGLLVATFGSSNRRSQWHNGGVVELWNVSEYFDRHRYRASPSNRFLHHGQEVVAAAFSPDGRTLLTRSVGKIRLWDVSTGRPIGAPLSLVGVSSSSADSILRRTTGDGRVINTILAAGPDGRTFLTVDRNVIRLWDLPSGAPFRIMTSYAAWYTLARHKRNPELFPSSLNLEAMAFNPQGQRILTAYSGHTFPPERKKYLLAGLLDGDTGEYRKPMLMAARASGGELQTWRAPLVTLSADGKVVAETSLSLDRQPYVRADGRRGVRSVFKESTIRFWETGTWKPIGPPRTDRRQVHLAGLSRDGRRALLVFEVARESSDRAKFYSSDLEWEAQLRDVRSWKPVGPAWPLGQDWVAAFSPDGRTALTSSGSEAQLRDAVTGAPLRKPLKHDGGIGYADFSPDGRTLITRGFDDVMGGRLSAGSGPGRAQFSARRPVDKTARLWDAATGMPRGQPLRHAGAIVAVAFSPDSRSVLTASDDGIARLWDVATGWPLSPPLYHPGKWSERFNDRNHGRIAFSRDGGSVVTATIDGRFCRWNVPATMPATEVERLALWTGTFTQRYLDVSGIVRPQTIDEWRKKLGRLGKLGGAPVHPEAPLARHRREAQEGLRYRWWDWAVWHLDRLIRAEPDNWRHYADRGRALHGLHRYKQAAADLSRALQERPNDVELLTLRSQVYFDAEQWTNALKDLTKIVDHDEENVRTWYRRGLAYSGLKQWKQADADFSTCLNLHPGDSGVHYLRGLARFHMQQWKSAAEDFSKAGRTNLTNSRYYRGNCNLNLKRYDAALADYREVMGRDTKNRYKDVVAELTRALRQRPDDVDLLNVRGVVHLEAQQWKSALKDLTKVVELERENARAWYRRGLAYSGLKQWKRAEADFSGYLKLEPASSDGHYYRGLARFHMHQWKSASGDFLSVRGENELNSLYYRGYCADKLKQYDAAIQYYREAVRRDPGNSNRYSNLAHALRKKKLWDESFTADRQAIGLNPQNGHAHAGIAHVYEQKQEWGKAIASYKTALPLLQDEAWVHYRLGKVLQISGRADEAIAVLQNALKRWPRWDYAEYHLGRALHDKGRLDEAIVFYKKALPDESHNDDAFDEWWQSRTHFHLAHALTQKGQLDEAAKSLERSQKLRKLGVGFHWFLRAMLSWKSGDKTAARRWHARAVEWTRTKYRKKKRGSEANDLQQLRSEVEELMGLKDRESTRSPVVAPKPKTTRN